VSYFPQMCMHCDDAACMAVCKPNAIYRREDGLVVIDPLKCTGCQLCPDACPHGRIYFNETLNIAQKCTGCAHLLDDEWDVPRCVDACPTEALQFGEEVKLRDLIGRSEPIPAQRGPGLVHYLNLPKKFVAGTVFDPIKREVIIGAVCTLTDKVTGQAVSVESDDFGDFWLHAVGNGNHPCSLKIEKDGAVKVIDPVSNREDVNLGDIPLPL